MSSNAALKRYGRHASPRTAKPAGEGGFKHAHALPNEELRRPISAFYAALLLSFALGRLPARPPSVLVVRLSSALLSASATIMLASWANFGLYPPAIFLSESFAQLPHLRSSSSGNICARFDTVCGEPPPVYLPRRSSIPLPFVTSPTPEPTLQFLHVLPLLAVCLLSGAAYCSPPLSPPSSSSGAPLLLVAPSAPSLPLPPVPRGRCVP